jgi:hypothetical protein
MVWPEETTYWWIKANSKWWVPYVAREGTNMLHGITVVSTIFIVGVLGIAGFAGLVWFAQSTPQHIAAAQAKKDAALQEAKRDYENCLAKFGVAADIMERDCRAEASYYP